MLVEGTGTGHTESDFELLTTGAEHDTGSCDTGIGCGSETPAAPALARGRDWFLAGCVSIICPWQGASGPVT
ncbi:hypothetical protein GCM10009800_54070 [Nocardiopsis rhodophaea]